MARHKRSFPVCVNSQRCNTHGTVPAVQLGSHLDHIISVPGLQGLHQREVLDANRLCQILHMLHPSLVECFDLLVSRPFHRFILLRLKLRQGFVLDHIRWPLRITFQRNARNGNGGHHHVLGLLARANIITNWHRSHNVHGQAVTRPISCCSAVMSIRAHHLQASPAIPSVGSMLHLDMPFPGTQVHLFHLHLVLLGHLPDDLRTNLQGLLNRSHQAWRPCCPGFGTSNTL